MNGRFLGAAALAMVWTVGVPGAGSVASLSGISVASAKERQARKRWSGTVTSGGGKTVARSYSRGSSRYRYTTRSWGRRRAVEPVQAKAPAQTPPPPAAPNRDTPGLTTASIASPSTQDAMKESMRAALEARARIIAARSPATPEPLPILLQPRSVTVDLERGTRTVIYGDDIVVTDPIDPKAARALAGLPASPR